MRTSDVDILILPGVAGDASDHWYARWEAKLPTARRIAPDAARPTLADWSGHLVAAVTASGRPVVLVAHDLGVFAVADAAGRIAGRVAGAFLVAAPSPEAARGAMSDPAALVLSPLPFPAVLVASRDDPQADWAASEAMARAWGAELVDAGASGHLDGASGHGPWPEGLMRFAGFLKHLPLPAQASP